MIRSDYYLQYGGKYNSLETSMPMIFFIILFLFQFFKLRFPRRLTPSRWLLRDTIVELPREVDQEKTTIERDKYDTPGHSFYNY